MSYIDLADLGVVYGDGSDSTAAMQTAIAMIRDSTSAFGLNQRYLGIAINGHIRTNNIPELSDAGGTAGDGSNNASNGITIKLAGKWELNETLVLRHARLIGEPWYAGTSFSIHGGAVLTPSSSMPDGTTVLQLVGHQGCTVENIDIVYRRGVGIESWGPNRSLKNVNIGLPNGIPEAAGYPALVIGNGYWIYLERVNCHRYPKETFPSLGGYPDGAVAVIASNEAKPIPDYTGIMTWKDSVNSGGSIVLGAEGERFNALVTFRNVITEYSAPGTGEHFLITKGHVEHITIDECGAADPGRPVSLLDNRGYLIGCEIKGAFSSADLAIGNQVNAQVWSVSSCQPYHGMRLKGSGTVNGMYFGRHEDDGIRDLSVIRTKQWELPMLKLPAANTAGVNIGVNAGFEVGIDRAVQMGLTSAPLKVGDAIVLKTLARVGSNQHLSGGEVIIGFTDATIDDGCGGSANYTINSFRMVWPILSGGDLRIGGHWREVIACGIVKTVGRNPSVNCCLRGISSPVRFLNPSWWRMPAAEYDGIEHLRQLVHKLRRR